MDIVPLVLTFEDNWFPNEKSVDGLLMRLDWGESISVKDLKEACKREGRTFKIIVE